MCRVEWSSADPWVTLPVSAGARAAPVRSSARIPPYRRATGGPSRPGGGRTVSATGGPSGGHRPREDHEIGGSSHCWEAPCWSRHWSRRRLRRKRPPTSSPRAATTSSRWPSQPVVAYKGGIKGLKATAPKAGQKIDPLSAKVVKYVELPQGQAGRGARAPPAARSSTTTSTPTTASRRRMTAAQANKMADRCRTSCPSPPTRSRRSTRRRPRPSSASVADGGLWETGGRASRRGRHHRHHRRRHLAREPELRRPRRRQRRPEQRARREARLPADPRLARPVRARRAVQRLQLQPEADRRPLLQRGLGRQRRHRRAAARGSTTRRATSAATAPTPPAPPAATPTSRPPARRPCSAPSAASRRAPASRPTRSAGRPGTGGSCFTHRQRRRHRPGRRRRRGRHQLLDQRQPRPTSATRSRSRSCTRPTRASSSPPRPATAARPPAPWPTPARGSPPSPPAPTTATAQGSVTLGNGVTYTGASVATAVGPRRSSTRPPPACPAPTRRSWRSATARRRRRRAVLDPAKVAGKIVVCDRGVTARVNKSLAVQEAGGVGMILVNTSANSINADFHFVPTVHLQNTDRAAVKAYAATAGATATINQATIVYNAAGAVHGVVLVARPAPRGRRRPAQAGPHRPRPGHPGRGRAARQRRPRLRPVQRHLDVQPARGRPRGAAQGPASRLVADGDQVGPHDDGLRRPRRARTPTRS